MALTVNPAAAVLTVNPASLSFSGQAGATDLTGQREDHKYWGWHAYLHGGEQPALVDALSRVWTAPSSLQISPSVSGLKAGSYTGQVTVSGGGLTKSVTVMLTLTAPPVQHSVALSWKASANAKIVSYCMYRSTIQGSLYGLPARALGSPSYSD